MPLQLVIHHMTILCHRTRARDLHQFNPFRRFASNRAFFSILYPLVFIYLLLLAFTVELNWVVFNQKPPWWGIMIMAHGGSIIRRHSRGDAEKREYFAINWIILLARAREKEFRSLSAPSQSTWACGIRTTVFTSHGLSDCLMKQINTGMTACVCAMMILAPWFIRAKSFINTMPVD